MADPATVAKNTQGLLAQITNEPLIELAIKIAFGLVLVWIGVRIGRWTANIERRLLLRAHVDVILAEFLRNITYAVILVLILVSALDFTGFPITTLLTTLGAAGIAIGLALKDSLAHIAAGVVLIVLRPFRVGDTVNIANQEGIVEGVFIFQTRLHSSDNRDIVLMNGAVLGAPIINYSRRGNRRTDLVLRLALDADLKQAIDAAREAVRADARIDHTPEPVVTIAEINEHGAALSVQVWCRSEDVAAVRSDLLVRVQDDLAKRGIALLGAPVAAPKS